MKRVEAERQEHVVGCVGASADRREAYRRAKLLELLDTQRSLPKRKTLIRWREEAPAGFVFLIKAPRLITHEGLAGAARAAAVPWHQSDPAAGAWLDTLEAARTLGARAVVFETPAGFTPTRANRGALAAFFERVERDPEIALVWDPAGIWAPAEVRSIAADLALVPSTEPSDPSGPEFGASLTYVRLRDAVYDARTLERAYQPYRGLGPTLFVLDRHRWAWAAALAATIGAGRK